MAGTHYSLRKWQLGEENAHGTAVAATEIMMGVATLDITSEMYRNQAPHGVMAEHAGSVSLLRKGVDVQMEFDGVTYQQLPWLLGICLDNHSSAGTPSVHTFDPPGAALWTPISATLEGRVDDGGGGANDQEDVQVEYVMGRSLELSGTMGEQLKARCNAFGRQVAAEGSFASLSVPSTLNHMVMRECKVYFNDTWALADLDSPAAGQLPGATMIGFTATINTGLWPFQGVDDSDVFAEHKQNPPGLALRLNCLYEPNASAEGGAAERVHAAAMDQRFVTISFTGDGNLKFRLVMALKHEKPDFHSLGTHEGYDAVEMSLLGHYDPTGAALVKAVLTNDDADPF